MERLRAGDGVLRRLNELSLGKLALLEVSPRAPLTLADVPVQVIALLGRELPGEYRATQLSMETLRLR